MEMNRMVEHILKCEQEGSTWVPSPSRKGYELSDERILQIIDTLKPYRNNKPVEFVINQYRSYLQENMGIIICVDSKAVADVGDPSDACDWLMTEYGLPKELFIKDAEHPAIGPTWEDLPLKFYWNGRKYMLGKIDNLRQIHEREQQVAERGYGTGKEMGKFKIVGSDGEIRPSDDG